jgi:hypothetical protein
MQLLPAIIAVFVADIGVSTSPAEAVETSTPHQLRRTRNCTAVNICRFQFGAVAAGRRFDIKYVSCTVYGPDPLTLGFAYAGIQDYQTQFRHYLLWGKDVSTGGFRFGQISQPIVYSVKAGQTPEIAVVLVGSATFSECAISGDLVKLN